MPRVINYVGPRHTSQLRHNDSVKNQMHWTRGAKFCAAIATIIGLCPVPVVGQTATKSALPRAPQETARERAVGAARTCLKRKPYAGKGVHRTPLDFSRVSMLTHRDAVRSGEKGLLASLNDDFVVVAVPESPPMDQRTPNGRSVLVNVKTGTCRVLTSR